MKYFTTSVILHLAPGDIIDPRNATCKGLLWLTTSPTVHFTLYSNGDNSVHERRMNTYEVRPCGKVKYGDWDDLVTTKAVVVVRNLGQANKNGAGSRVISKRDFNPTVMKPKHNCYNPNHKKIWNEDHTNYCFEN